MEGGGGGTKEKICFEGSRPTKFEKYMEKAERGVRAFPDGRSGNYERATA